MHNTILIIFAALTLSAAPAMAKPLFSKPVRTTVRVKGKTYTASLRWRRQPKRARDIVISIREIGARTGATRLTYKPGNGSLYQQLAGPRGGRVAKHLDLRSKSKLATLAAAFVQTKRPAGRAGFRIESGAFGLPRFVISTKP